MFFVGHIAGSYLLAKSSQLLGYGISSREILSIVVAGNVLDLDLFFGFLLGKKGDQHHDFITHTPFMAVTLWTAFELFYGSNFSLTTNILILVSLLLHLVLDDIGYWFWKLGLREVSSYSQINWAYPFTKFQSAKKRIANNNETLNNYFRKAKANIVLEIVLALTAILIFILV